MNPIIIVPYRNREEHLSKFLSFMHERYSTMRICIVEQTEGKPFNRGKLLNIGYLENKNSHYVFHDVDMLPMNVNYLLKYNIPILQLAKSKIQLFDYLGGVTRFTYTSFKKAGGYHNDYFHRAEDNEMMFNLKRLGMNVINKPAEYYMLEHERKDLEFDPGLWQMAQLKRASQDQLSICKYEVIQIEEIGNVKHIVVSI